MHRFAVLMLILLGCIASFSCQTYTTGLQQSVARADETGATSALRLVAIAQTTYAASNGGDYGTFPRLSEAGYLDSRFNSEKPTIKDYVLSMTVTPKAAGQAEGFYSCNADPVPSGAQAGRHFYLDSTSRELHVNPSEAATAKDPTAQP